MKARGAFENDTLRTYILDVTIWPFGNKEDLREHSKAIIRTSMDGNMMDVRLDLMQSEEFNPKKIWKTSRYRACASELNWSIISAGLEAIGNRFMFGRNARAFQSGKKP